jgi:hypothetical protein
MNSKDANDFNIEVLGSIQHAVARYCIKSLAEANVELNKEVTKFKSIADGYKDTSERLEASSKRHEAAALANKKASEAHLRKAQRYEKAAWIGIPSTAVVCTAAGAGTVYVLSKKGIININN